jgi:hypothetical protein
MAGIQRENITQGEAHPGPGDLTASAKSYIDANGSSITWQPQSSKEGFNLSASLQVSPAAREPPSSPRSRASSHSTSSHTTASIAINPLHLCAIFGSRFLPLHYLASGRALKAVRPAPGPPLRPVANLELAKGKCNNPRRARRGRKIAAARARWATLA